MAQKIKYRMTISKVKINASSNNIKFKKSYFGKKLINQQMAKNNSHTPDRQITPDDDLRTKDCTECNGTGEVIEWDEDDNPEPTRCPATDCVNGQVPIDETDLEDEW